ncbi:MAG: DUF4358 domain-containing protein [Oscillospiraceae bacterium]|nr:DUF4358 domain-containing protein [Oscillospiraceae bacterium]
MKLLSLCLCLALLLAACAAPAAEETDWTPVQIVLAVETGQLLPYVQADRMDELPTLRMSRPGDAAFERWLSQLGLDPAAVADGALVLAEGPYAMEFSALLLPDAEAAARAAEALEAYRAARAVDFTGYAPEQEALLRAAAVLHRGRVAALFVCPEPETAEQSFARCFSEPPPENFPDWLFDPEPTPTPTPTPAPTAAPADDWSYDHDRLTAAWDAGDWSDLHEKDRAILDTVAALLDELARPGQTLPELELAIHDWMVDHMAYDTATLERYGGIPDPDDDNPYGALVHGLGICEGYTSSFQLLMDLIGIPCLSVKGHSDNGREYGEHAWNQVLLDGDWYVVDVTWDDPLTDRELPAAYHHRYYNVTSDGIRHNHFWDEESVPAACGTRYAWQGAKTELTGLLDGTN